MKAWIENGRIRDICHGDPTASYHPDIAAHYTEDVPDDAANGDEWDGVTLTKPVVVEPVPVEPVAIPPTVGPVRFKMLFNSEERRKAKTLRATDSIIDDFWGLLDDCIDTDTPVDLSLASVQGAIEYTLAKVGEAGVAVDVAARKAEILTGIVR